MNEQESKSGSDGRGNARFRVELVGLARGDERPDLSVMALKGRDEVMLVGKVDPDGGFDVPDEALKAADTILVGATDEAQGVRRDTALSYSVEDFRAEMRKGALALAEPVWSRFRFYWTCVSGSVRVCRRRPWWYDHLIDAAVSLPRFERAGGAAMAVLADRARPAVELSSRFSLGELLAWPVRCAPVCRGRVTVFRRTCCCYPIVIDDWRIADLIRDLERLTRRQPKPRFPKIPPPPPPPIGDPLATPYFRGGALNDLQLNAAADIRHLRSLPVAEAAKYIEARPYLYHRLCSCSAPTRVGSGALQADGTFSICWIESLRLFRPNCYDQYAYVVTQTIGTTTTTIYDGLAAGAWFAAGDQPVLTSYHPGAYGCEQTGDDEGNAYVFLDLIGDTESHELTTPAAMEWDRVAPPTATSGLLFPTPGPQGHLRNLGGGVELTFIFSLALRDMPAPAQYYRISVTRADASGNPTGNRHYHSTGLSWQKIVGADIVPEALGPFTVGGENNLYRIPYSDEAWVGSVRYHALLNTLDPAISGPTDADTITPAENHLVTLELFDATGQRLRPLGAPPSGQPGTEIAQPFQFRRWFQPGGSVGDDTVDVPYAALTHMFCWDNRLPVADITQLVMNGSPSDEECQFLEGPPAATFAVEYRAFVPDERFQQDHAISWVRGLNHSPANGGEGTLPTPLSPANVGEPPAAPVQSGSNSFALMLTRLNPPDDPVVLARCSFAVTLRTHSKTTNGEYFGYPEASETAAFALAIDASD